MDSAARLRIVLYLLLTVAGVFVVTSGRPILPFSPPAEAERLAAAGDLSALPDRERRAFTPGDDFAPIPAPGPGDWLARHRESGQTYDRFVAEGNPAPGGTRRILYLLPVGGFGTGEVALDALAAFAEAFFAIECRTLPPVEAASLDVPSRRNVHTGRIQLHAGRILARIRERLPADGFCLLAVTLADLYPSDSWNYVFGLASPGRAVGVYSFARFDPVFFGEPRPDGWRATHLRRAFKLLAHEAAHLYGILHCIHYGCLMNGGNSLAESDRAPLRLCPVCLRKLHRAAAFDIPRRYDRLRALYETLGLHDEARWIARRRAWIEGNAGMPVRWGKMRRRAS